MIFRLPTPTPRIGGGCAIVAGLLAIVQGILIIAFAAASVTLFGLGAELFLLGAVEIILGAFSLRAGLDARQLRRYGRTLIGAILGMVGFGFFIGGFLGLVAVILIALSRQEFSRGQRPI